VIDIVDAERRVRLVVVGNPVDEARPGVILESEGNRNAAIDRAIVGGGLIVHAMGGEDHRARVDQRACADKAVVAIHDADAVHVAAVDDVRRRLVIIWNDGMSCWRDAQSGGGDGGKEAGTTGAHQQLRPILTNVHDKLPIDLRGG